MPRPAIRVKTQVLAGLLALVLAGALAVPSVANEQSPSGSYPSWQDVENAKQDESAKAAEIATITGLLDGLQSRSEDLGNTAVTLAAEYAVTQRALDEATARLDVLAARSARASAELARSKKDIGTLAAESYKTGGTNMGIFVAMEAVRTDSAHGLSVVQQVGHRMASLVAAASAAEKAAHAQAGQEQVARIERERLAADAGSRLSAARSAQAGVVSHLEEQQKRSSELIAQLASLKGTTATAEASFREGQAAAKAYSLAQAAKRAAAEEQVRKLAAAPAPAAGTPARPAIPAAGTPARPAIPAPAPAPAVPALPAPLPAAPANPVPAPQVPAPQVPAPEVPAPQPVPAPAPAPAPPPVAPVVPVVPGGAVNDPAGAKAYASSRLGSFGWGQDQFPCLVQLWTKESNWLTTATNPYSGAYGIAQSLPASKYSSAGSDWLTSYRTQVDWGLAYIQSRYGSPCSAWAHSVAVNWY